MLRIVFALCAAIVLALSVAGTKTEAAGSPHLSGSASQLLHLAQKTYIEPDAHGHQHHHGDEVYGDPKKEHWDCEKHGNHRHCQRHIPPGVVCEWQGSQRVCYRCRWENGHEYCYRYDR